MSETTNIPHVPMYVLPPEEKTKRIRQFVQLLKLQRQSQEYSLQLRARLRDKLIAEYPTVDPLAVQQAAYDIAALGLQTFRALPREKQRSECYEDGQEECPY